MSIFSGKCDLCDHIAGQGGWYDKEGNPVKMGDGTGAYYSDEMQDFIAFKKKTGGVIHQHKKVLVTLWNQEEVQKHCPGFYFTCNERSIKDNRYKSGIRTESYYDYYYYGKKYTLKELNQKGVYITIDIYFNTLLDLIPYYPHIISTCACNDDKETVYIGDKPYPLQELDDSCKTGGKKFHSFGYYAQKLNEHYRDVVLRYFDPFGRHRREIIKFDKVTRIGKTSYPIDSNFNVEWEWPDHKLHEHWTSPKIIDEDKGLIEMSEEDMNGFLGDKMIVHYIEKVDHELYLG